METKDYLNYLYELDNLERSIFLLRVVLNRPLNEIADKLHISSKAIGDMSVMLREQKELILIKHLICKAFENSDVL